MILTAAYTRIPDHAGCLHLRTVRTVSCQSPGSTHHHSCKQHGIGHSRVLPPQLVQLAVRQSGGRAERKSRVAWRLQERSADRKALRGECMARVPHGLLRAVISCVAPRAMKQNEGFFKLRDLVLASVIDIWDNVVVSEANSVENWMQLIIAVCDQQKPW